MRVAFVVIFGLLSIFFSEAISQGTKTVQIIDTDTKSPLIGVNVTCGSSIYVSDETGRVSIDPIRCNEIILSYIGYETLRVITSSMKDIVSLKSLTTELETTIITASRYERRLSESTVSVDVIKPNLIQSINAFKADEILNKLPGVQVVGGQANIRGGSGFSYGAGSRVMILIDDIPALQADAGLANWGDLPIEHLDQVEVIKGASSALFGSSALNGIINFRRKKPKIEAENSVFIAGTYYDSPKGIKNKWWGNDASARYDTSMRYKANLGFSHSKKYGKTDFGLHGFLAKLESYNFATYENRFRVGTTIEHHTSDKLSIGLNAMINKSDASDFFLWQNITRNIYLPANGTISEGNRLRITFDPYLKYNDGNGNNHRLLTRFFYTNNQNNNNQSNKNLTYFGEYQFQKTFKENNLVFTSGLVGSITDAQAELFGDSTYLYTNIAGYIQLEKKWFDKFTTVAGIRHEYNKQSSPTSFQGFNIPNGGVNQGKLISRLGLNYQVGAYSSARFAFGQGYRYPTVTERFISTNFGGFQILPNPLLTPEFGSTLELGFKQGIKVGAFKGFIDVAAFLQQYQDMIEFTFINNPLGFRPLNVGDTQIKGLEASIIGTVNIWKIPFTVLVGATTIDPRYKNLENNVLVQSSISTTANVLKYRSKHSAKVDVEGAYKGLTLGLAWQYYSHMINIDRQFEQAPIINADQFEIKAFRDQNNQGFKVMDIRTGYRYKKVKLSIIAANIFNVLYAVRPGLAEAPKNYSMRMDVSF
jgi:iron complex outermembrane receptor protein